MMKNFEQRKAEILRRSAERKAKRKKRIWRISGMAVCFACLVACTVAYIPQIENDSADTNVNYGVAQDMTQKYAAGSTLLTADDAVPGAADTPAAEACEDTAVMDGQVALCVTELDLQQSRMRSVLSNNSGQQLTYSPWFDIERQTEDGWVSCAGAELNWEEILYILEPGDTATLTHLLGAFDLSEAGTYRLVKDCNLYVEEDSTPYWVVAEFVLEEAP